MLEFAIKNKIISDWLPLLEDIHAQKRYAQFHEIIPQIKSYFHASEYLDDYVKISQCLLKDPSVSRFKELMGLATEKMEIIAKQRIIDLYSSSSDDEKMNLINFFGCLNDDYQNDPVLRFEQIRSLKNEAIEANISSQSKILVIGTGPISVSALYYASKGAHITILDKDPDAIKTFLEFKTFLPKLVQDKITTLPVIKGEEFDCSSLDLTHILIAGLAYPKNKILDRIRESYKNTDKSPLILMRVPQPNFLHYFYYDIDQQDLSGFEITKSINKKVRGSLSTNVLRLLK